ncbi:hypothetical protein GCM10008956_38920 [Deinococcus arenae]|uniref:Uncharacterized protein n=1 Tax=Deinococcus arenae TaxID=1452751 RepID=A0A8H9LAM3_9DEIO|nr:hypothetical protein [Deinococcus arenae]AWT34481.1 hypothetical protein DM785_02175 [Deinococcus actinosclerus]GGM59486.1 hypothetical protein GCM10008956_38920 [Deinococcus arenae]
MDRLETVLDVGALPLKGGRRVYARQVSRRDEAVLQRASMVNPAMPVEIVTTHGVITVVVSHGRSLDVFVLYPAK